MAKKVNALKLAQEQRGQADVTNRRPAPFAPALYLMQLRMPRLKISPQKKKLPVLMVADPNEASPQPVKITHIA